MSAPSFERDAGFAARQQVFATTHWSVVLAASQTGGAQAQEALERLCRTYWYPLYGFVRRKGYDTHTAQDLTQAFFVRFLAKNYLAQVDREKGRFRSFLLASLNHFLANEWDRARAEKRGGGCGFISWDELERDGRVDVTAPPEWSAERVYEHQWALTLLNQVFARLREECLASGKGELFEALRVYLSGEKATASYAEAGEPLNMTAGAVQVAVHRLRRRYGDLLREEIAHTVNRPEEINEEIRHLFAALRG
jgi:RNA polymerase sigma-70 factor (ECF subfamily)